ncbi:AroM family protein [Candidatus Aminicenantes bacterium AC-335-B20]|nr:AroM family protein [SCandidatus Aminicenantes bacterium Aminicenantia_JdfR_composite]MCP2598954.1 AroM family protein [Candidatus Aminicenantes bacterium AC-335-B20]
MKVIKICLLTIGQSPRRDIVPEIKSIFLPEIKIMEKGLLDNLSEEEIKRLKPQKDEDSLISILRNGKTVQLAVRKVESLLEEHINKIIKENIKGVGILCTHDFMESKYPVPVIFPCKFIKFLIEQVYKINKIGIVIPLENQIRMVKGKFRCREVILQVKSPYIKEKGWEEIADIFKKNRVEGVVLDCIGYNIKDKVEIEKYVKVPVFLPRLLLVHLINLIFS